MFFNRLETPRYPEAGAGALVEGDGLYMLGTALEGFHAELWLARTSVPRETDQSVQDNTKATRVQT
jgi:hypothetical protein